MGLKREIKDALWDGGDETYISSGPLSKNVAVVVGEYGGITVLPSDVAYSLAETSGVICDQPEVIEMKYDGNPLTVYVYERA